MVQKIRTDGLTCVLYSESLLTTGLNQVSHRLGFSVLLFRASALLANLTIIVIKVPTLVESFGMHNYVNVGLKKRLLTDYMTRRRIIIADVALCVCHRQKE